MQNKVLNTFLLPFLLFIEFACHQPHSVNTNIDCTTGQYEIQPIRDSTVFHQIIGIAFSCDSNIEYKTINFFYDNPWRNKEFQILPEENPFIKYNKGDQYKTSLSLGHIPFELNGADWRIVKKGFQLNSELALDSFTFSIATSACRPEFALPDFALTNYSLELQGSADSLKYPYFKWISAEGQIKIYNPRSDIVFSIDRINTAFSSAVIDSTHRYLILRSSRSGPSETYTGIEIHNIIKDTIVFKFELDSNYLVYTPNLYGNYIVTDIYKKSLAIKNYSDLWRTLIYDLAQNKMFSRDFDPEYASFRGVSSPYLVYASGEDDDSGSLIEYDSIDIHTLPEYRH